MFDDRIEIYSPGGMYDGTKVQDRNLMQVPSRRRNPIIADIFNRLKYMDRRGSGFKKIIGDYRIQPQYNESKEPEFNSDNDSFLLVLKNLNYEGSEAMKKNGDKKTAIIIGNKKVTTKTQQQYEMIINFMENDKEYGIQDFCNLLQLKESRTKDILKGLIENGKIETAGAKKDRRYRLPMYK